MVKQYVCRKMVGRVVGAECFFHHLLLVATEGKKKASMAPEKPLKTSSLCTRSDDRNYSSSISERCCVQEKHFLALSGSGKRCFVVRVFNFLPRSKEKKATHNSLLFCVLRFFLVGAHKHHQATDFVHI